MRLRLLAILLVALVAGCGGTRAEPAQTAAPGTAAADVRFLAQQIRTLHPNPFHSVSRAGFDAAAADLAARADSLPRDELLVELMRLCASLGEGEGHTGVYPLAPHARPLRLYPIRLHDFRGALHVVGELGSDGLLGRRLVAVNGVPVERVSELVRPLVGRDNESSLRDRLHEFVVTAEVLSGLRIAPAGPTRFAFDDGREVTLEPVPAGTWAAAFHDHHSALPRRPGAPLYVRRSQRPWWTATLERGRVVYIAYNQTSSTYELSERLRRLLRPRRVRRVVLDLRNNGGGDNTTYGTLLADLRSPRVNRRGRLYVLIGRRTFSAAGNLATELDLRTRAIFVGEPTGGGRNQYGDAAQVTLPTLGWQVYVPTSYQEFDPGSKALAVEPDVPVEGTVEDYLAGRDPVLAAALR